MNLAKYSDLVPIHENICTIPIPIIRIGRIRMIVTTFDKKKKFFQ